MGKGADGKVEPIQLASLWIFRVFGAVGIRVSRGHDDVVRRGRKGLSRNGCVGGRKGREEER